VKTRCVVSDLASIVVGRRGGFSPRGLGVASNAVVAGPIAGGTTFAAVGGFRDSIRAN